MKTIRILGVVLIAGLMMTFGSEIGNLHSIIERVALVPAAEARVGQPLTPVSVAGVARRSVRRCAVGVYHCRRSSRQPLAWLQVTRPASVEPTITNDQV